MARPVNQKCIDCLSSFNPRTDKVFPECWNVRICSRRRHHYAHLEASRDAQRMAPPISEV